ncbi:MAG: DUF3305 domain-containing protein [Burkholderiales bacterium]
MQRTPLASRWATERWEPVAVMIEPPGGNHGHAFFLQDGPEAGTRWRFTALALELHRSEAEGYHLNLTAPAPMVFVMWRMLEPEAMEEGGPAARPELATVSYDEAARMLDGGERVDGVPMPVAIRDWMAPFVAEHYKPEPKRKVRRRDPLSDEAQPAAVLRPSTKVDEPQRE